MNTDVTKFGPVDRQIVKSLFLAGSAGIEAYSLHLNFMYSPAQIVRSIRRLSLFEVVHLDGENIQFQSEGRKWVIANRKALFANTEMSWKKIPEQLKQPTGFLSDLPTIEKLGTSFIRDFSK